MKNNGLTTSEHTVFLDLIKHAKTDDLVAIRTCLRLINESKNNKLTACKNEN